MSTSLPSNNLCEIQTWEINSPKVAYCFPVSKIQEKKGVVICICNDSARKHPVCLRTFSLSIIRLKHSHRSDIPAILGQMTPQQEVVAKRKV